MWLIAAGILAALLMQSAYVSVPRSSVEDIQRACREAGLLVKQVAAIYGVSEQQFYQQARGQGHISIWRLIAMKHDPDGRRFLRAYMPLVLRSMGLSVVPEDVARDIVGRVIDQLQVIQGRAQLAERDAEEGAA